MRSTKTPTETPPRHRVDTKRQQPERAEQAAIVKLLKLLGANVYVIGTVRRKGDYQGTCQTPGIPDLYCFLPRARHRRPVVHAPTALWIEVKAPNGRTSSAQLTFGHFARAAGTAHLIGGLDVVTDWLKAGGWIR
jgi:hypothetical protein